MKTTLQFKLSFMFFMVMLISATVSISLLLVIFSPIMRNNAKEQLAEMAVSINTLNESVKDITPERTVSLVTNSSFTYSQLKSTNKRVSDGYEDIQKKGYYITASGMIPKATMVIKIQDQYYLIESFSNDSLYWIVNFVIILSFIGCIVIGTIITVFVGRTILKPLHEISRATSEVARGNFKVRVRVPDDIEYGMLANNFNKMAVQLSEIETLRGDFISSVSHEFKTPLASIQGFAKLLQDENISEEDRKEYTQVIIDETDRLTALVNDILDLSKLENGSQKLEVSTFDAAVWMEDIIARYKGVSEQMGYHISFTPDESRQVTCDAGKMERVVCNLINNAINYTGEDKQVFVRQVNTPEGVRIEVRDTGEGIPEDKIRRIFAEGVRIA